MNKIREYILEAKLAGYTAKAMTKRLGANIELLKRYKFKQSLRTDC